MRAADSTRKLQRDFLEAGAIRALNTDTRESESREFELSFSSETPVERSTGYEILDHSEGAADLRRLRDIGVVLFNHHADQVIGSVRQVEIKDGRGIATIRICDDEFSDQIYRKIKDGTLRGVSFGYVVDEFEEVLSGKRSLDGRFEGPALVGRRWWPFELSIVSVPADSTVGVGRSMITAETPGLELYERQYAYCRNLMEVQK